jgi:hypothetical protein
MQIIDTSDPLSRSSAETEEFAHFKRDIYQKVLKIIFQSLRHRSHDGETHCCADGISRILLGSGSRMEDSGLRRRIPKGLGLSLCAVPS